MVRKEEQKKNLEAKTALCEKVESIDFAAIDNYKDWDEKSKELVKLQKVWRTIGFAPKKDNDAIWKEFRGLCDSFFTLKKDFFKERDNKDKEARDAKKALIDKANALKSSEDWKDASHALIQLQKQWKTLKGAGRYEKKLWEEFRGACDYFFTHKEDSAKAMDKELTKNLKDKQAFILTIKERVIAAGFDIKPGDSPIVPIMLYDAALSQKFADMLLKEGIYAIGFFYPVVGKGQARIRTQISAAHSLADLDKAANAFIKVGKELGVIK